MISARMNDGTRSAARIAQMLDAIEKRDGVVRSYCEVLDGQARADAERLDRIPDEQRGPLHGAGIAIKEVFDVAGGLCAWGSEIHAGRRPKCDAVMVRALREAGGIILGTTASTEYAMARMAPTTNPFDAERTPGASSSGSAAAVAAGMADIAIGSQTIGSGIRPAAYCGVIGYKPTQGALSLEGGMPLSDVLDHPVLFAEDMSLVVKTFRVLCDSEAALSAGRFSSEETKRGDTHASIALVSPWFDDAYSAGVWEMVSSFAHRVGKIDCRAVSLPAQVSACEEDCLTTILSADMWRHHRGDYQLHSARMSDKLKTWLERGRDIKSDDYRAALDLRLELMATVWNALADFDFVVTLATTDTAPLLSEGTGSRAPQRLWNLLGCPAISVPVGTIRGLPVGVQIISRPGTDAELLRFAVQTFRDTSSIATGG